MKLKIFIAAGIIMLSACGHQKSSDQEINTVVKAHPDSWQGKMSILGEKLSTLVPYLSDSKKFSASENDQIIKAQLKEIANVSRQLNSDSEMMKMDPSMRLINAQFEDEIVRGLNTFELGLKDYARFTLKNSTSYCIQCHTRTNLGPAFSGKKLSESLGKMSPLERGEFLTAIRNFDDAMKEFESILSSSPDKTSFNLWERATRNSLAIAVKYKQDPDMALSIVNKIQKSSSAPKYLNDYAKFWNESLMQWKNEKNTKADTLKSRLSLAKKLIAKGQKKQDLNRHAGDIEFLRASALLHRSIGESEKANQKAEIYWLLGQAYDSLTDLDFWQMTDAFYQKCIDAAPHTAQARKCYKEYEDQVTMGYTGTAGTDIPAELQKSLKEYKDKAK